MSPSQAAFSSDAADGAPGSLVLDDATVRGTLFAHGATIKAGGSASWTVVSDARVKVISLRSPCDLPMISPCMQEIVGDFRLHCTRASHDLPTISLRSPYDPLTISLCMQEIVGDFGLGRDCLMGLRPRVFRFTAAPARRGTDVCTISL